MGDLPLERAGPAVPFEFTTLDLFGPYEVKDESAEGFLLAYQRFTALRGHPRKLWSDPGSNFIRAKPALTELYKFLDKLQKSELEGEAAKHGTEILPIGMVQQRPLFA
ncbi:hypothetical protein QQF64_020505 [Cirrhinus molitorella]|uniref:Uncharacterized protein n=1 Tax=Cirrhinus molitorella TaxID=172907 RepID=A0ABR3L9C2_9TELE